VRIVLATVLLLAFAEPAQAATVGVSTRCEKHEACSHMAGFSAAAGERNDITITREAGTHVLRDARNPVAAGRSCTSADEHSVRCAAPPAPYPGGSEPLYARARLGDEDDVATATEANVDGGAGDDKIEGTYGTLTGGQGSDKLRATGRGSSAGEGDGRMLLAARRQLRASVVYREYGSREGFTTRLALREVE
jgi:hypothetical protein